MTPRDKGHRMIAVRVHRWPILEQPLRGKAIRTKKPVETRELLVELVKGHGIYVYFPFNDVRLFTKSTGVGRGVMRDWLIDAKDLVLLHVVAK